MKSNLPPGMTTYDAGVVLVQVLMKSGGSMTPVFGSAEDAQKFLTAYSVWTYSGHEAGERAYAYSVEINLMGADGMARLLSAVVDFREVAGCCVIMGIQGRKPETPEVP